MQSLKKNVNKVPGKHTFYLIDGHLIEDATHIKKRLISLKSASKSLWIHLNMEQLMLQYKTEAMCYDLKDHISSVLFISSF